MKYACNNCGKVLEVVQLGDKLSNDIVVDCPDCASRSFTFIKPIRDKYVNEPLIDSMAQHFRNIRGERKNEAAEKLYGELAPAHITADTRLRMDIQGMNDDERRLLAEMVEKRENDLNMNQNNCHKCGRSHHVCDCGIKQDSESAKQTSGKPRFSLLSTEALEGIMAIREYGSLKYKDPESWKTVSVDKYMDAAMRHLIRFMQGEKIDLESGLPHIDHAMCNIMFISHLEKKVNQ